MKNLFKNKRIVVNSESGFTLIELLIVIVVLGILMSMAVPALSGVKRKADLAVVKADLHNIMQCLEMYYLDQGEYPAQVTKAGFDGISGNLEDLNIKNEATAYQYQSDTASNAGKYLISYQAAADEYYYISSDDSALSSPVTADPSL